MKSDSKQTVFCAIVTAIAFLIFSADPLRGSSDKTKAADQNASAPEFSLKSGIYSSNLSVRLTSKAGNIHYTTDGSEPTEQSPRYSGPLKISESTVIRARRFDANAGPSSIVSQTYTLADEEVLGFNSNLPLVVINLFGRNLDRETKTPASLRVLGLNGGRSSMSGSAEFDGRMAMNIRGNTSLRYPKRSFHLKTRSEGGAPLKKSILGLPKESDWVLYAPYPDKTIMRDVLAYELSNKMGRYAPRTRFVEVFVSASGKLSMEDYLGVYVFEEKIKRSKERVDIAKLGPEDVKEPDISGGFIFKKDHLDRMTTVPAPSEFGGPGRMGGTMIRPGLPSGPGGFPAKADGFLKSYGSEFFPNIQVPQRKVPGRRGLQRNNPPEPPAAPPAAENQFIQGFNDEGISSSVGFNTPMGNQFFYVEPKPGELASTQKNWLKRYLMKFERALYGPDFLDPDRGYAAFIDVDSFIDHHLLVEATKNVDGFRFSTFYYKDRGGKIQMGPIWDWNLAFGNVNGKQGWMPRYWYWPQLDDNQYSWFRRLFQDPDFGQKYIDRWAALRTNVFATSNVLARIDEMAAQLNEAQARNFRRWPIMGRTVWPNHVVGETFQEEVNTLKEYIQTRFSWIDEQFVAAPEIASGPNSTITLSTPKDHGARIYYMLDGSDPRSFGGTPSPAAKLYDSPIAFKQNSHLFARAFQDKLWSSGALRDFSQARH